MTSEVPDLVIPYESHKSATTIVTSPTSSSTYNTKSHCAKMKLTVNINLESTHGTWYDGPAIIDTGSSFNIISLYSIPVNMRNQLTKCQHFITGVSSKPIQASGYFRCTLKLCRNNGSFRNTSFLVIPTNVPTLIGLEILDGPTVQSFEIDNDYLNLNRQFGTHGDIIKQRIPFVLVAQEQKTASSKKPFNGTLSAKLQWLQDNVKVTLPVNHDNKSELAQMSDLLMSYADVFGHESGTLGLFPHEVSIPTEPGKIVNQRQHPIPRQFHEKLDVEIQRMLDDAVIEPCDSTNGWNSPILVTGKKNGSIRVCANFKRTVNTVLLANVDKFQLPATDVIFHEIGKNNIFSKIDLKHGYWHLKIRSEDRHKTAFQYKGQAYQFVRLPFGLRHSGDMFCRATSHALFDVQNQESLKTFVDDILVHNPNFKVYFETTRQVLQTCRKHNMRVNGPKCDFLTKTTTFLGRILKPDGYSADLAILKVYAKCVHQNPESS